MYPKPLNKYFNTYKYIFLFLVMLIIINIIV